MVVLVSGHLDVTLVTPAGSPGVLDQPVVSTRLSSVTNSQNTVVELRGRATRLVVDTSGVELEGLVRGINGNRNRSLGDGNLEGRLRSLRDVLVRGQGGTNVGRVELARVGASGGVRVGGLSINTMVVDDVLEGLVHKSSVATLVSLVSGAIDKVLLRERDELLGLQEVSTLNGTSSRERPARSALTLVLDRGDGTMVSPIPRGRDSNLRDNSGQYRGILGDVHATSPAAELSNGLVGELVKSNGVS